MFKGCIIECKGKQWSEALWGWGGLQVVVTETVRCTKAKKARYTQGVIKEQQGHCSRGQCE